MKLILLAILLSIFALGMSTYVLLMTIPSGLVNPGLPSFEILDLSFSVLPYRTQFQVENNGTAIAHNVRIEIRYGPSGGSQILLTEFIPELEIDEIDEIFVPIGTEALKASGKAPSCPVEIYVACKEGPSLTFGFSVAVP